MPWTGLACVAEVYIPLRVNFFLLFIGKESLNMAVPQGAKIWSPPPTKYFGTYIFTKSLNIC